MLCLAHVTNQMGLIEGDFEKGVADGRGIARRPAEGRARLAPAESMIEAGRKTPTGTMSEVAAQYPSPVGVTEW